LGNENSFPSFSCLACHHISKPAPSNLPTILQNKIAALGNPSGLFHTAYEVKDLDFL